MRRGRVATGCYPMERGVAEVYDRLDDLLVSR
jgi:hypothetical protein